MNTLHHAPPAAARRLRTGMAVAACWAGLVTVAHSASVQVAVLDAAGKPVPDAVVFLDSAQARQRVKPLPGVEMGQDKKLFMPDVLVVPVGTEVRFPNNDSVRHHVYSFSPAKKFEIKLYAGTPTNPVLFDRPGVVVLGCNIHDLMVGWVVVVDTPHYTLSAAPGGRALIDNVPPGNYTLRTWHSRLPVGAPALEQAITVPATGTATASVRMTGLEP
jgi:plastocyanin